MPQPGEFGNETWEGDAGRVHRQHQRLVADERRRRARLRLPAVRHADQRLLRRPSPRQQPVRREPRLPRRHDRQARLALPGACTTASGTTTSPPRRCSSTSPSTAGGSTPSRRSASRGSSTCSIAGPAQPVWPIEERPVPQSTVPGEKTSPTQPFPTKPPAFERQGFTDDDVIDFTPELKAQALEIAASSAIAVRCSRRRRSGARFSCPATAAARTGAARRSIRRPAMLYVPSITSPILVQLVQAAIRRGATCSTDAAAGGAADARRPAARQAAVQPRDRLRPEHRARSRGRCRSATARAIIRC